MHRAARSTGHAPPRRSPGGATTGTELETDAGGSWNRQRLLRGLALFAILTAIGFWVLRWRGQLGGGVHALRHLHPLVPLVGLLLAGLDQVLGGLRQWLCARAIGGRVGLWTCVRANAANVFLGGVTPSQSGAGPGQILILARGGLTYTQASVVTVCTFLGTVTVFLLLALRLTLAPAGLQLPPQLRLFTGGTVGLFAGCLVGFLLALEPRIVLVPITAALRRVPRVGPRLVAGSRFARFRTLVDQYAGLMRDAVRHGKLELALGLVLSAGIYLNKFCLAWVVVRGLGLPAALSDVIRLQELQVLVTYFAPTPGASGLAEISASQIMRPVVPDASMGAFILLWRIFGLYCGMALGALVVLRAGLGAGRTSPPAAMPGRATTAHARMGRRG